MKKFKLKAKVLLLEMATVLLFSTNVSAQEQNGRPGGLFGGTTPTASNSLMDKSSGTVGGNFTSQGFGGTNGNITGQTFGAPLGGGLFVLLVAGVSYATIKSRKKQKRKGKLNMKRISIIILALAFSITMTQCKKEQNVQTIEEETVAITLDIKDNEGLRMDVNTHTGEVNYEEGDVIYVVSSGKYIGTLTHNGTNFSGAISNPTVGEPLHFYFLGNVTPDETLIVGTTESCSVVISDQTEHLPVIEYAPSDENYTAGTTAFTAFLLNKCALVKFDVTSSSEAATCVMGFNNMATIDFTDASFTYSKINNGNLTLPSGNGERWVILLPQDAMDAGEVGSAYSVDGAYTGTCGAVPAIYDNGFLTSGIEVNVTTANVAPEHEYVDLGLPSGLLWATCNVGANTPEGRGDYFAWGETQTKDIYNWNTYQYCMGSYNTYTKYCNNSEYGYNGFTDNQSTLLPEDDAATANWGNEWRMPSMEEWQELYDNTIFIWTTQNGVEGRLFTASNGNSLFLCAAGYREESRLQWYGDWGGYWSSSLYTDAPCYAWSYGFYSGDYYTYTHSNRYYGWSVRAVRDAK